MKGFHINSAQIKSKNLTFPLSVIYPIQSTAMIRTPYSIFEDILLQSPSKVQYADFKIYIFMYNSVHLRITNDSTILYYETIPLLQPYSCVRLPKISPH